MLISQKRLRNETLKQSKTDILKCYFSMCYVEENKRKIIFIIFFIKISEREVGF